MRPLGAVVTAVLVGACGHIGFDERDVPGDPDAAAACPADMVRIEPVADVCVETNERGNEAWTSAQTTCAALGRRLCDAAEWLIACTNAPGLVDMANDAGGADPEWEWFAGEADGVAEKGGYAACTDTSSHSVVDPYDYRCCLTLGG
jgi:hypothetical protein